MKRCVCVCVCEVKGADGEVRFVVRVKSNGSGLWLYARSLRRTQCWVHGGTCQQPKSNCADRGPGIKMCCIT
jgi:hypothetical protein